MGIFRTPRYICFVTYRLIPEALSSNVRPSAGSDGSDPFRFADQKVSRILASGNDRLIAVPYQQAQLVGPKIVPDVLH